MRRPDNELKDAVVQELKWTPSVNSAHIGVAVNGGAVTLSGEVDSFPEKMLASRAVERVHGVTAIAQEITVQSQLSEVTDTDIAMQAGDAIQRAVDVPETVKVAVHNHVITLSGSVQWHYQRQAADRAVDYLKGVQAVVNTIAIRPTVSAENIKTAIRAALMRDAQIESQHITVNTDKAGVVTLEGTVNSWPQRRQAENVSWSAPGVTEVVDHLSVDY
ncbi:MAG TPA: BON domain-containing protein [Pseudonocardiaceae bacterium]|jgi:osmotically-inducible protein OsmY|nr:BON domain-containing protein [Pseudonocardiaceae bacterium]